jgi:hypothetical protein
LQLLKVLASLASRKNMPGLVQECISDVAFRPFFPAPSKCDDDGYLPPREEEELENSLLAATFTFALRSMSNLVKITSVRRSS